MSLVSLITQQYLTSKLLLNYYFSFNGVTFKKEPSTQAGHQNVFALGNFKDSPFITGSDFTYFGVTTSILNYEQGVWLSTWDQTPNHLGPEAKYPIGPKYV